MENLTAEIMATNVIGRSLLRSISTRTCTFMTSNRYSRREGIQLTQTPLPGVRTHEPAPDIPQRSLFTSAALQQEGTVMDIDDVVDDDEAEVEGVKVKKGTVRQFVDVQTSMEYMKSEAFRITYGDALVWEPYRRNHKGPRPRRLTRKTCIRGGVLATGNPCPICRDEYLTIDPTHTELLRHFISPNSGQVISSEKTGLCQVQHKKLLIAVHQAWDRGYLEMPLPQRVYDYSDYYPEAEKKQGR